MKMDTTTRRTTTRQHGPKNLRTLHGVTFLDKDARHGQVHVNVLLRYNGLCWRCLFIFIRYDSPARYSVQSSRLMSLSSKLPWLTWLARPVP